MVHICGIAGSYAWGNSRLSRERLSALWKENEFRGRDAAGVAYLAPDKRLMYLKQRGTATELMRAMNEGLWEQVVRSPLVLLHTRAATQGTEADNDNNHPVVACDWVVTHNGVVVNDDYLFAHFKETRPAAVDTAAINLLLGKGQSVEESLPHVCTLQGSASVAAVHVGRPNEVILFRINGAEVHLYWLPTEAILVWSSDRDGYKAVQDLASGGFAGMFQAYTMPNDTALHLTPTGLKRYTLTRKPFGPSWKSSGGSTYGGSRTSTGFFTGSHPQTTGGSTNEARLVKKLGNLAVGSTLAILRDNKGLLEEPLFHGTRQEYHYVCRYDSYVLTAPGSSFIVPTGYGRWFLMRMKDGSIAREFKPHRRVRRRWEQEFGIENALGPSYTINLPASVEQADDLSDLLQLGQVDLVSGDQVATPAFMCPWCGILRHPDAWRSDNYTCPWCHVPSRVPKTSSTAGSTQGGEQ